MSMFSAAPRDGGCYRARRASAASRGRTTRVAPTRSGARYNPLEFMAVDDAEFSEVLASFEARARAVKWPELRERHDHRT